MSNIIGDFELLIILIFVIFIVFIFITSILGIGSIWNSSSRFKTAIKDSGEKIIEVFSSILKSINNIIDTINVVKN